MTKITTIFVAFLCLQTYAFAQPANNCVLDIMADAAFDLTALIDAAEADPTGWSCESTARIFSNGTDHPTATQVNGDIAEACLGASDPTDRNDIWFKVTLDGTENIWLDVYREDAADPNVVTGLYSSTSVTGDCTAGVDGLTYIDCAYHSGFGENRDVGNCTTPIQNRIDLSGLVAGTYYIRIWNRGGGEPTAAKNFFLCAESSTPVGIVVDDCSQLSEPTIGCLDGMADRNVTTTYTNISNAGTFGNADVGFCDGNNGIVAGDSGSRRIDEGCTGSYVTQVAAYANTVVNNNGLVAFEVISSTACQATADLTLTFDNLEVCCGDASEAIQVQVLNDCTGSTAILAAAVNGASCFSIQPPGRAPLTDGMYFVSVEGQNGALLSFDLTIDIQYLGCPSAVACESSQVNESLSLEVGTFTGKAEDKYNVIEWTTVSEINNDYFDILRSMDGQEFEKIDAIAGNGTTKEMNPYMYIDKKPTLHAYYQLRAVDTNGNFSYSNIIMIDRRTEVLHLQQVYPIPTEDRVHLNFTTKQAGSATLFIADMYGKQMAQHSINAVAGDNQAIVDLKEYATGVYFLTLVHANQQIVQRVVKQ